MEVSEDNIPIPVLEYLRKYDSIHETENKES